MVAPKLILFAILLRFLCDVFLPLKNHKIILNTIPTYKNFTNKLNNYIKA